MLLPVHLRDLVESERALAHAFRIVSRGHAGDAEVHYLTESFGSACDARADELSSLAGRFEAPMETDSEQLSIAPMLRARSGPLGLLRDLQELYIHASGVAVACELARQAGMGLDDRDIVDIAGECLRQTHAQLDWLRTTLDSAAPQALIVG